MPPVDPKAARQLRSLPSRHIATKRGRCHLSVPASPASDLDDSLDDDYPLAVYRNQETHP